MLMVDGFATFFRVLVLVVGILTILPSYRFLARQDAETSEYHALLICSIAGQCLMAAANDLIIVFIGLEISSIASYVLAGYLRDDKRSNEAALKYFPARLLRHGFLPVRRGADLRRTGSVNLTRCAPRSSVPIAPLPAMVSGVAAALMFVGLGFKVSAAPFQIWAPDVYQGAPTPVAAFLSAGPKAAAFAIFLRIFMTAFEPIGKRVGAAGVGFGAALDDHRQLRRAAADQHQAHAGVQFDRARRLRDGGADGALRGGHAAAMFYLAAYALHERRRVRGGQPPLRPGERYQNIEDFAGLGQKQPLTAAMLSIFLLSLIGVPLTGGFFGKFYIFKAALESHLVWLTVLGLLNSAVAAYYYLRILVMMYMREPGEAVDNAEPLSPGLRAALILPALGTLLLGIFPGWVLEFAGKSAALVK
jgi:NADH-quinone oxidoreductase subunit N